MCFILKKLWFSFDNKTNNNCRTLAEALVTFQQPFLLGFEHLYSKSNLPARDSIICFHFLLRISHCHGAAWCLYSVLFPAFIPITFTHSSSFHPACCTFVHTSTCMPPLSISFCPSPHPIRAILHLSARSVMGLTESQLISEMYVLVPNIQPLAEESNSSSLFNFTQAWDGVKRADSYPLSYSLCWPVGNAPAVLISVKLWKRESCYGLV